MRALVQTVSEARVTVDGAVVGEIKDGLLILVGVTHTDTEAVARLLARKAYELRILDGDARKGRRPSWSAAAPAAHAEPLVDAFAAAWAGRRGDERAQREFGADVATGRFGARMLVASVNVGPRTVVLEL